MTTPPPNPLRPSPLSFNREGRASPFRRPNSPLVAGSPSTVRATNTGSPVSSSPFKTAAANNNNNTTPASSPLKPSTPTTADRAAERTGSPLRNSTNAGFPRGNSFSSLNGPGGDASSGSPAWLTTRGVLSTPEPETSPTRRGSVGFGNLRSQQPAPGSLLRSSTMSNINENNSPPVVDAPSTATGSLAPAPVSFSNTASKQNTSSTMSAVEPAKLSTRPNVTRGLSSDPTSQIPPALLHTLRESFSVLDTSNSGSVTPQDLANTLSSLGIATTPSDMKSYFPPGTSSMSMASYLQQLAFLLAPMSSTQELLNAFSAFDDDDSGQVDVDELADALLHVAPEKGDRRLNDEDIDVVMEGYRGRRAFGKRSTMSNGARKNGEVFRYREFVEGIVGGKAPSE